MPADILATDTLFPELNGKETVDQKFEMVTDYLWLLREQLTFALTNLGIANFNASQLTKLGNTLTEPFAVMLAEQDKKFVEFEATIDGINGTVSALDETFMKRADFEVTADGVKVTVGETTTELPSTSGLASTYMKQSAFSVSSSGIKVTVGSTTKDLVSTSKLSSTVGGYVSKSSATVTSSGFELSVMGTSSSGTSQTRMKITKDGMQIFNKAGTAVFDFDTTSGNLKVTGNISGSEIYGSTFYSLSSASATGNFFKISSSSIVAYQRSSGTDTKHGVELSLIGDEPSLAFFKNGNPFFQILSLTSVLQIFSSMDIIFASKEEEGALSMIQLYDGAVSIQAPNGFFVNGARIG